MTLTFRMVVNNHYKWLSDSFYEMVTDNYKLLKDSYDGLEELNRSRIFNSRETFEGWADTVVKNNISPFYCPYPPIFSKMKTE